MMEQNISDAEQTTSIGGKKIYLPKIMEQNITDCGTKTSTGGTHN
jgi:hypothetical protein